ncbi:hypothetical protein EJB05_34091, partial [Eragrostis curvula]
MGSLLSLTSASEKSSSQSVPFSAYSLTCPNASFSVSSCQSELNVTIRAKLLWKSFAFLSFFRNDGNAAATALGSSSRTLLGTIGSAPAAHLPASRLRYAGTIWVGGAVSRARSDEQWPTPTACAPERMTSSSTVKFLRRKLRISSEMVKVESGSKGTDFLRRNLGPYYKKEEKCVSITRLDYNVNDLPGAHSAGPSMLKCLTDEVI